MRWRLLVCAWLWLAVSAAAAPPPAPQAAVVTRVVDGDTVHVRVDTRDLTVRLIGVDTPELHVADDPAAAPQPFAREASAFTRARLAGHAVRLEFESDDRLDRFGRTLAYVFLADGTFFNRELIRGGYARAYGRFPFRFREQFLADEVAARQAGRGLWAEANARVVSGPVIGNRRSRLYHLPGQKHYSDIGVHNRVYFADEDAARAAGYAPARQ